MKFFNFIKKYKFLLFWGSLFIILILINTMFNFFSEKIYTYNSPQEMVQKAKIGEVGSLHGYKGADDFICIKKTEDLTECEWFFKETSSSKVIVQFLKSSKVSPEQGSFFNVRVKSRDGDILLTEAISVNVDL